MINVKVQLMEHDAITVTTTNVHCSLLLLNVTQQSCYMLDHCIGPSCLAYTIFTIAFHALMSQQCLVELYHASHMASLSGE